MRFETLEQWLAWQETLHPNAIDLGLERVRGVATTLGVLHPAEVAVITVGGTNGKGSAVAMLEAILLAAGFRVGCYTSPHLLRYNERIRINGLCVDDNALCHAFGRVDHVRGDTSLTYFEFGTLAALQIFVDATVDVVILEVGLGGRLDAVNIIDADVALVTSIGIDHVDWLGSDREAIGYEKAGIFRAGKPAVCGEASPPESLVAHAEKTGAPLYRLGHEYHYESQGKSWNWQCEGRSRRTLPRPALQGEVQFHNAASVLMVLALLQDYLPLSQDAVRRGLLQAKIPGRFQLIPGDVDLYIDVAHNPAAAQALAQNLIERNCQGKTLAVIGMLEDKDVAGVVSPLAQVVEGWYVAGLDVARGLSADDLCDRLVAAGITPHVVSPSVDAAIEQAMKQANQGDRVVVFGSFYVAATALTHTL